MKNCCKTILFRLVFGFMLVLCISGSSKAYTYNAGDYGFAVPSGNWGTITNWKIYNGVSWALSPFATGVTPAPSNTTDVFILANNTCFVEASSKFCRNLTVEAGTTKLYTNYATTNNNRYINLFGNIVCDGAIGNGATFDNICFNIDGANDSITGTGTFDCSRMRKNANNNLTTNLVIGRDITLRFDASSATQIYNNFTGNTIFNVTISPSCTLTLTGAGNASIDGIDGLGFGERGGFYNIYGTMIVPGTFFMSTDNTLPAYADGIHIYPGGTLKATNPRPVASSTGTYSLIMDNTSLFQIIGTPFTNSFSFTNNTYTLNPGSTIEYAATGPQTVETNLTYANLKISGPPNPSGISITGVAGSSATITTSISGVANDNTIVVGSAAGLAVGMLVSGTGIGGGALIIGIAGTTITLSVNNFAIPSGTGTFVANTINVSSSGTLTVGMAVSGTGVQAGAQITAISGLVVYLTLPNAGVVSGLGAFSSDKKASTGATVILGNFSMYGSVFYPNSGTPLVYVGGDWYTTSKNNYFETGSTVILNGSGSQNITVSPSSTEDFDNLKINKPSGKVFLTSSPATIINIIHNLDLTSGNIVTSPTNSATNYYVQLATTSTVLNVNDNSFIEGNCLRQLLSGVNITYVFPVGKVAKYRPITISGTPTAAINFFAEYFYSDPAGIPTDITNKAASLDHISRCEYWKLREQGGVAQLFRVTLSWDTYSACPLGVTNLPTLRVACDTVLTPPNFLSSAYPGSTITFGSVPAGVIAGMNVGGVGIGAGAKVLSLAGSTVTLSVPNTSAVSGPVSFYYSWNNLGNFLTTGTTSVGTIQTDTIIKISSSASASGIVFSLSSTATDNPLPIELISFTAKPIDKNVVLNWITASEKNNNYFEIEKSSDGINFENLYKRIGAGNSSVYNYYSETDVKPFYGISYYRLKQTDFDGKYSYSKIVAVRFGSNPEILLFPNPVEDVLNLSIENDESFENTTVRIYNCFGQLMTEQNINDLKANLYKIPVSGFSSGMYNLVVDGTNHPQSHFVFIKK